MEHQHIPGPLLSTLDYPSNLRELPVEKLPQVCDELRDYIIDIVSIQGGHFAASLGVVELTVALHYVFNTPLDQLVWDVGHQAYGHKILTGRRDTFHTNRKYGGVAGFPKRSESEYDTFGVAHASTSISGALGMARARDIKGSDERVVAIIGDGALTGGLAFEGLNNAGTSGTDLLVVVNDNRMSIDPNVGALNEYLARVASGKAWNEIRDEVWDLFEKLKGMGGTTLQKIAGRLENGFKATFTPGMLFESLGFRYFGPVDGHNVIELVERLRNLKELKGPLLLHTLTVKGKGFAPAEEDQLKWHATSSPFDKLTGKSLVSAPPSNGTKKPKWQDVFGDTMVELADIDERVVGITAAMPSGTSLKTMMEAIPERAYDVGIAEMHAVVEAAGLATQGLRPVVAIYSSFLQRAYDGIIHDVALQNLPVIFCMDRSGLVGADGPTHHGALDIPYLRCVQGMVCAAPLDEQDLRDMMYTALQHDGPFAIRYPRGEASGIQLREGFQEIQIGKGRKLVDGEEIAFLSYGAIGEYVPEVLERLKAEGIHAGHYDLRFVKPLDDELLIDLCRNYHKVITLEDGVIMGGAGSAVLEWMMDNKVHNVEVLRMGLPDRFVDHGTPRELYDEIGLGPDGIFATALTFMGKQAHVEIA